VLVEKSQLPSRNEFCKQTVIADFEKTKPEKLRRKKAFILKVES